jgi:hypothetical protein
MKVKMIKRIIPICSQVNVGKKGEMDTAEGKKYVRPPEVTKRTIPIIIKMASTYFRYIPPSTCIGTPNGVSKTNPTIIIAINVIIITKLWPNSPPKY